MISSSYVDPVGFFCGGNNFCSRRKSPRCWLGGGGTVHSFASLKLKYIHRGTHSRGRSRPFSRRIKDINSYATKENSSRCLISSETSRPTPVTGVSTPMNITGKNKGSPDLFLVLPYPAHQEEPRLPSVSRFPFLFCEKMIK